MVVSKHSCSKWSEQAPAASTWGIGHWGTALRRVRFWSSQQNAGALMARQNLKWNRRKQKTDHAGMPFSHRERIINHHCEEEEVRDGFTEEVAFGQGLKGKTWKVASRQPGRRRALHAAQASTSRASVAPGDRGCGAWLCEKRRQYMRLETR